MTRSPAEVPPSGGGNRRYHPLTSHVSWNPHSFSLPLRLVYYPRAQSHTYVFTFLAFSTVISFIMGLFTSIELSIGTGFGLFALFSILRYRTETIPIGEMTYLFVMAAMPILKAVSWTQSIYGHIVVVDILIFIVLWALDPAWGFERE